MLLVCVLPIIVGAWPIVASVVREGTMTAIVLLALIGLAVGHFLGGPREDDRTVLAFATVSRHPGVAIAVANLTDEPMAPIGVLLAVLVSELATAPVQDLAQTPARRAGRRSAELRAVARAAAWCAPFQTRLGRTVN